MGRPRKIPLEQPEEKKYITFRCNTLGGVYVGKTCMYFLNGLFVTNNKTVIDALRNMAHLGVVEESAAQSV